MTGQSCNSSGWMVLGICAVAVRDEYETVAPTHPETQRTQEHAQVDQIGEGVSRCCAATRIGRRATRHSAHPRGEPRPCPCPTVSSTSQSGRTTTTHEWFESLGAAERGVDATRARLLVASRLTLVRSFAYVYARTRRLREHSVLECDKNHRALHRKHSLMVLFCSFLSAPVNFLVICTTWVLIAAEIRFQ